MSCEHDFRHIDTSYIGKYREFGNTTYTRVDRFYCSKCLENKEVVKEENSREMPEWFKRRESRWC